MKKKLILITLLLMVIIGILSIGYESKQELKTIKSERQLKQIYNRDNKDMTFLEKVLLLPFSIYYEPYPNYVDYRYKTDMLVEDAVNTETKGTDYSKTNTQVKGVDEADIIKTDGQYIYSISNKNVIITNAKDPSNIKIEAKIPLHDIPVDLIIYDNKLVVIMADSNNNYQQNTVVNIYNMENKNNPVKLKSFKLYEPYFTTRCINEKLFIISEGYLREENDKVQTKYIEDNEDKNLPLYNIKYLKDVETNNQTLIAEVDLNNLDKNINLKSYLMDISNAYVSENYIYLLNTNYSYEQDDYKISDIFGIKGIFGLQRKRDYNYSRSISTSIYKFSINKDGVIYSKKGKVEGRIIDQYSVDENNNHLRLGLDTGKGSKITILDNNLKEIGSTGLLEENENMYSTRFINNRAYLVTYRNTDPLFVIDLNNESNPKVLGKLEIPGYSTYLHPYDENHLIGIGMNTEEKINRDISGREISTTAVVTGMKMSLFDVSDVTNPVQISNTVIGNRRSVSAVLTNPKALLFSKEKNLIAIPVNNYAEDFETSSTDTRSSIDNSFINESKNYISEGYFVYNINLEDGFKLKGVINHEKVTKTNYYYYYYNSKLLRGLYINDNLFTVSEDMIKVNKLDDLSLVSELKIK